MFLIGVLYLIGVYLIIYLVFFKTRCCIIVFLSRIVVDVIFLPIEVFGVYLLNLFIQLDVFIFKNKLYNHL